MYVITGRKYNRNRKKRDSVKLRNEKLIKNHQILSNLIFMLSSASDYRLYLDGEEEGGGQIVVS